MKLARQEKSVIRHRVYERSGGHCEVCRQAIVEESGLWTSMHLHHIVSRGAGGSWDETNLKSLCLRCHMLIHSGGKVVPSKA